MKKILFIIYTYSLGGGAEAILTNVVNHLNPSKYQIDILEYAQYGTKTEVINKNIHRQLFCHILIVQVEIYETAQRSKICFK